MDYAHPRLWPKTRWIYCFVLLLMVPDVTGQQLSKASLRQLESNLKKHEGFQKLKSLNMLTAHYQQEGSRKALRMGRDAVDLAESLQAQIYDADVEDVTEIVRAYFQLGELNFLRKNYQSAETLLKEAKKLQDGRDIDTFAESLVVYLAELKQREDEKAEKKTLGESLQNIKIGEALSNATKGISGQKEITLGEIAEKKGDYQEAVIHYQNAIEDFEKKGSTERTNDLKLRIATLLEKDQKHEEAQLFLEKAISELESIDSTLVLEPLKSSRSQVQSFRPSLANDSLKRTKENLKNLSERAARNRDFERSLSYFKLYQSLTEQMKLDSVQAANEKERRSREITLLRQQKQIADLNVAAAAEAQEELRRTRNWVIAIAMAIFIGSMVSLLFYFGKRKQHRKLTVAYLDLDRTRGKLVSAEKRITKLLKQQVSGDIAQQLLMNSGDQLGERLFVCIMFLDIRGFTPMAEQMTPEELISYQNNVFGFMIDIVQEHKGNINQLLGDGFMATFGAPLSHGNDCQNAYEAALKILREMKVRNEAGVIKKTKLGIGLHAGFVVTGNVGTEARKQYSVTGNTVIVASRVEQLNKTYKSQLIITQDVYDKLEKPMPANQSFLEVEVKGRSHPIKVLKIA